MRKFGDGHEREMLLACLPFSKPEEIGGTWYSGFELNAFYEGAKIDRPLPALPGPVKASLEYDPHLPNDGHLRVLQMQLIGRRSQCPISDSEHVIIVDRVISSTIKADFD